MSDLSCRIYLVVLDMGDVENVVDEHIWLHDAVIFTHFEPSKYVPLGHEQPSTRGSRQHLSPNVAQFFSD